MGGGVSSLPAEVSLAEAKELAGAKWQPAWEEKFAEAKISRDEAVKCWKESEAKAAISEALCEKLHGTDRSGVAEALDFSAIVARNEGSTCPARASGSSRRSCAGGRIRKLRSSSGSSAAAARARALPRPSCWRDCSINKTSRRGTFASTPSRRDRTPAVLLRSLAGMLCATVKGFEDALKESAGVETDKVEELFEALVAKPLQKVEAPRGADDALVLIIDALDELPRDALKPVLSLLAKRAQDVAAVD